MEILAIALLIAFGVWITWRVRTKNLALSEATLDRAWQIVLDDPNYQQRRLLEEEKHDLEARAGKVGL